MDVSVDDHDRWYRMMAACAVLVWDSLDYEQQYALCAVLDECHGLVVHEPGLLESAAMLCEELLDDVDLSLFAHLGRIIAKAETRDHQEIEAMCEAFRQAEQRPSFYGDHQGEPYLWGTTHFDSLHGRWLRLVENLPSDPAAAGILRDELLLHGAPWRGDEGQVWPRPASPSRAEQIEGMRMGLRLPGRSVLDAAELLFALEPPPGDQDDDYASWLSAANNAIHRANELGEQARAARWADAVRDHAAANHYLPHNLACAFMAVGRRDDAMSMVEVALESGGYDIPGLLADDELAELRGTPRWRAAVERAASKDDAPG